MADQQRIYYAPWEKAFERIATPFEEFLHRQTTTGILLIGCAIIALGIANSPLMDAYEKLLHLKVGLTIGDWSLKLSVHHWINDGLMAIFFFVVGLEIKREVLMGELSDLRSASLPVIAAIGGMVVPALLYWSITTGTDGVRGWGIPMATDIAFAVGVVALLGSRVPKSLVTFLVALAIVDDLGAVTVIALFYTETLSLPHLGAAGVVTLLLLTLNLVGIRNAIPYFLLAILLWFAMQGSGVHATIAGIIGAFTVPLHARYRPGQFYQELRSDLEEVDRLSRPEGPVDPVQTRLVWSMDRKLRLTIPLLERLESAWHIPSTYLVIPLFALANAAIPLDLGSIANATSDPVALATMTGLVLGKPLGIAGTVLIAHRLGLGALPHGVTPSHIVGAGLLAGIGFTMSIFIAELAFAGDPERVVVAKMGILGASLVAGISGYVWLRVMGGSNK